MMCCLIPARAINLRNALDIGLMFRPACCANDGNMYASSLCEVSGTTFRCLRNDVKNFSSSG